MMDQPVHPLAETFTDNLIRGVDTIMAETELNEHQALSAMMRAVAIGSINLVGARKTARWLRDWAQWVDRDRATSEVMASVRANLARHPRPESPPPG